MYSEAEYLKKQSVGGYPSRDLSAEEMQASLSVRKMTALGQMNMVCVASQFAGFAFR